MTDSVCNRAAAAELGNSHVRSLELKIPPPAVAAVACVAMWWISVVTPSIPIPQIARVVAAIAIAAVAGVFGVGAAAHFRRANTTVNPVKPQAATSLVTAGVYGYTRNPMYLALLLVLIAWAVLLSSPSALVGPAAFVAYLNRYQIAPEERVLSGLFGAEYVGVRRLSRASSPVALNSPWDNL